MSTITRAITHIRLDQANPGKLAHLDALADEYMRVTQAYVTAFCTTHAPAKFAQPWIATPLSQRWQRVAIQQAAGIAQAWRTNRDQRYAAHLEARADHQEHTAASALDPAEQQPAWREPRLPTLRVVSIITNANVAGLEPSAESSFDYWLRISTLTPDQPIRLPVRLAAYHRAQLAGRTANTSMILRRDARGWWLTLTLDEQVAPTTTAESPVVGVDVGIVNFLTTSTGKHYGTFHGKLARRHQRDREKRRRKAKLRACLKKKGVTRLPSLTNQRLARHVRQSINRAVNLFYADHPGHQVAYEALNVRTMRFRARRMNAYLYASNLGHLPRQLAWGAQKRGQRARAGAAAYSSQECPRCHHVERANRPTQATFACQACSFAANADQVAALNHQARFADRELRACTSREQIKALLQQRHLDWQAQMSRLTVVEPPADPGRPAA